MIQRLRFLRRLFVVLVALLGLVGCGKKSPDSASTTATPAAPKPMVWRVGNASEPQDLDPQTVTGVPEHKLMMAFFEGLVTEDPKDLHPIPGLAESWEISPDGLTYTFHQRALARR